MLVKKLVKNYPRSVFYESSVIEVAQADYFESTYIDVWSNWLPWLNWLRISNNWTLNPDTKAKHWPYIDDSLRDRVLEIVASKLGNAYKLISASLYPKKGYSDYFLFFLVEEIVFELQYLSQNGINPWVTKQTLGFKPGFVTTVVKLN